MRWLRGYLTSVALASAAIAIYAVSAGASVPSIRGAGPARLEGTFKLRGLITRAVDVRGDSEGERVVRLWRFKSRDCRKNHCDVLHLHRQRSDDLFAWMTLRRSRGATYRGAGVFYAGLDCLGHVYRHGSRAPYTVSVTVTSTIRVGGVRWANRITATYVNRYRTDNTRCPMLPAVEAARYTGSLVSRRPRAPAASFRYEVNAPAAPAQPTIVTFTGAGHPGTGGFIRYYRWDFGDRGSGSANRSRRRSPSHTYSVPGRYLVTLTVRDHAGMTARTRELVVVPAPPVTTATTTTAATDSTTTTVPTTTATSTAPA